MTLAKGEATLKRLVWLEPSSVNNKATLGEVSVDEVVQGLVERDAVHQKAYGDLSPRLEEIGGQREAGTFVHIWFPSRVFRPAVHTALPRIAESRREECGTRRCARLVEESPTNMCP